MLDQLIKIVKESAGDAIINNPAIPNEKNDLAINTAASSIFDNLKDQVGGGGLSSLMDMFTGGGAASSGSIVDKLTSGVGKDLMAKLGIDQATAMGIVSQLIPVVMSKLKNKTNDPNDKSIDLEGIIGSLTGKGGGDILGKVKGIFGM